MAIQFKCTEGGLNLTAKNVFSTQNFQDYLVKYNMVLVYKPRP